MKTIITAMGNPTLNNELIRYEKYNVLFDDFFYQDAIFDGLQKITPDVIIVSGVLQGQLDIFSFIQMIKEKSINSRIIVIMDELESDIKCKFLELGIKDIFVDDQVDIPDILEAIDREDTIVECAKNIEEKKIKNKIEKQEKIVIKRVQKQEVIAISGINGSGKSTIAYNLSKTFSNVADAKILVIDLDTTNGNIDELFDISKIPTNVEILLDNDKKCGLNYAADLILKERFDANVLEEIVIKSGNVDVLTGNTSLYFCEDVLNEAIYSKLLNVAKEKYDFIIIDTSSNVFLDSTRWAIKNATRILFVTENNYLCMKKTMQIIDVFIKNWGTLKDKIQFIINKKRTNGIETELIEKILEDYCVIGEIRINSENEQQAYEKILENINFVPKSRLIERIIEIKNCINEKAKKYLRINNKEESANNAY